MLVQLFRFQVFQYKQSISIGKHYIKKHLLYLKNKKKQINYWAGEAIKYIFNSDMGFICWKVLSCPAFYIVLIHNREVG